MLGSVFALPGRNMLESIMTSGSMLHNCRSIADHEAESDITECDSQSQGTTCYS